MKIKFMKASGVKICERKWGKKWTIIIYFLFEYRGDICMKYHLFCFYEPFFIDNIQNMNYSALIFCATSVPTRRKLVPLAVQIIINVARVQKLQVK